MARWIVEMKAASRGPFSRIRWFCNDGEILPPEPFACREHDGGVQHGQWSTKTLLLRDAGYSIATVFTDLDVEALLEDPERDSIMKAILLEQFLIAADDGWIYRQARFYRGALQAEEEAAGGRRLLQALAEEPGWRGRLYPVLREAVRLVPHGGWNSLHTQVRQQAALLAEEDPSFNPIRTKMHVKPDAGDASLIRAYGAGVGPEKKAAFDELAGLVDRLYARENIAAAVIALAPRIKDEALRQRMQVSGVGLSAPAAPDRLAATCRLLAAIRVHLGQHRERTLALLDLSLELERELLRLSDDLRTSLPQTSRGLRLTWLTHLVEAVYGVGLISARQSDSLQEGIAELINSRHVPPLLYKERLDYMTHLSFWANRSLLFHFQEVMDRFSEIEPLSRLCIDDRLHTSPLLFYAEILDGLLLDADTILGLRHLFFGEPLGGGLQALNAGLARGRLCFADPDQGQDQYDRQGIYVLPVTAANLPPVAGILTAGKGNSLSHVQLLARNLGIPNVAVEEPLLARLRQWEGQEIVMAVSPGGVVQFAVDGPQWDKHFAHVADKPEPFIIADPQKLDLAMCDFLPLSRLQSTDAGRIAGPKAANLGELQHHFPAAVSPGLVLPFGCFRAILEKPFQPGGPSAFQWLQNQYKRLRAMQEEPEMQEAAIREVLAQIRQWITAADPGEDFRRNLHQAMQKTFGDEGTYGVFVRSDTNVEDLPGFTGAGLNLTVPNVVGFPEVLDAIVRVWASPFSERAYRWRQMHMDHPEELYVSVLLLQSVPAEKSGVMVTADIDTGSRQWLSVAVNEGVGGAVNGQAAEELRIRLADGFTRLLAQATEPRKAVLPPAGGVERVEASGSDTVLDKEERMNLVAFARQLPDRFPMLRDQSGQEVPADVEFGFIDHKLVLFQIRPFLNSARARRSSLLEAMDRPLRTGLATFVAMDGIPDGRQP